MSHRDLPDIHVAAQDVRYLTIPFTSDVDEATITSPEVAIVAGVDAVPAAADWDTAEKITGALRVLLGATPFVLAVGWHTAWARFTDNPEIPAAPVARLLAF